MSRHTKSRPCDWGFDWMALSGAPDLLTGSTGTACLRRFSLLPASRKIVFKEDKNSCLSVGILAFHIQSPAASGRYGDLSKTEKWWEGEGLPPVSGWNQNVLWLNFWTQALCPHTVPPHPNNYLLDTSSSSILIFLNCSLRRRKHPFSLRLSSSLNLLFIFSLSLSPPS